jgi:protein kinase-like protein
MPAQLISCGEFAVGVGGEFERECARRLRDGLPDGYILATNVSLERGGGSFLECDMVASAPGVWVVCEMKALRAKVDVFEDLLRGAGQFTVDRVFSTLDLKAKVLRARRDKPPFPSSSIHTGTRIRTLVIVPDECDIRFHHKPHGEGRVVVTVVDALKRFQDVADEALTFGNLAARRELQRAWEAYCQSAAPGEARTPRQLGRYRVKKQLQARTRGVVEFHAVDEPPSTAEVRLREFPIDPTMPAAELDAELARLAREMTVLRKIRHPYVACVTGHFQTGCSWVEVSDWFDGKPIEELWPALRDATVLERAGILLKIIAALAHCHERGVFHRNVSASAVLVSADFADVRLGGFELARDLSATSTLSGGVLVSRDPRLVPPEELRGGSATNPRLGDVFQVGVLLYRLLENGAWPFSSTLDFATAPTGAFRDFIGPEEAETPALRRLARRLMALEAAARPDQMERVEQEIESILAGRVQ